MTHHKKVVCWINYSTAYFEYRNLVPFFPLTISVEGIIDFYAFVIDWKAFGIKIILSKAVRLSSLSPHPPTPLHTYESTNCLLT